MPVRASKIIRVIVIIIFAAAASTFLYLLVNNFQFTRGVEVRVHFTSVGDLNTGAWVRKAGLKVGSVTRLEPAEDEKTIMATLTFRPGRNVRRDDKFALIAKGILGDMYIEQNPGPKDSPLVEPGHIFEGQPAFSISDLLTGDTMGMVTDLASSLRGIVDLLKKNQNVLESSLKDIAKTAQNVRIVTDRAVEVTQSVPDMTARITSSVDQLQSAVTDASQTTKKLLAKLEGNISSSSDDLAASMKSMRQSTADIQAAVAELTAKNSVIATLGAPDTAQSLETTMKNLEAISRELLAVTRDTQKIVQGVSEIFDAK
jgi:phospholipid/cholesterol/gamma-HCH transport system substrate-binding protein